MASSPSNSTDKHLEGHKEEQIERLATYDRSFPASNITDAHRDYLIERHGTYQLDPLPDFTNADPLNWSNSKASHRRKPAIPMLTGHRKRSTSSSWHSTP